MEYFCYSEFNVHLGLGAPSGMFGTLEVLTWSSEKSGSDSYKGLPWKDSISEHMTLSA